MWFRLLSRACSRELLSLLPQVSACIVGVAAALWRMVIPRRLADVAGELSAWMSDSSDARAITWLKESGPRSLEARLASAVSCAVRLLDRDGKHIFNDHAKCDPAVTLFTAPMQLRCDSVRPSRDQVSCLSSNDWRGVGIGVMLFRRWRRCLNVCRTAPMTGP